MPPFLPSPSYRETVIQSSHISISTDTANNTNMVAAASTSSASHSGPSQDSTSLNHQNIAAVNRSIAGGGQAVNIQRPTQVQDSSARNMQMTSGSSSSAVSSSDHPFRLGIYNSLRAMQRDRRNQLDCPNQPNRPLRLPVPVTNPVSASLPLPPNWNKNMESVNQSPESYKLFPVPSWTREFQKLTEILDPLFITGIQQIVNPTVWKRFVNERNEMLKAKSNDPMVLKELGLSDQEIAKKQQSLNLFRHSDVDGAPYDDNFALLLHCTKDPANVELILRDGFDERLSKGGMLGKAIYFSDKPRKSISYDRCDGVIFICGVLLGDSFTCKKSVSRDITKLVKGPEKLPAERRYIDDYYFDSVIGNFEYNEYAVYSRYQCYPLYQVTYSKAATKCNTRGYSFDCDVPPPFGWRAGNEFLTDTSTWEFRAKKVFGEILNSRFHDYVKTNDALHQRNIDEFGKRLKEELAASQNKSEETLEDAPKKRRTLTLSTEPDHLDPNEECWICYNLYSKMSNNCVKLQQCEDKLCAECYKRIEITRETMAGVSHTSIKCPFCQLTAGIVVGICPKGQMRESIIPTHCAGYEGFGTIVIIYTVKAPIELLAGLSSFNARLHSSTVYRRRAFLPNNTEGQSILNLLRIAWDRRIIFTVGTSHTTGRDNSLVWNIHHKSSQTGGSYSHGYPDATYFVRVREELKSFGIE